MCGDSLVFLGKDSISDGINNTIDDSTVTYLGTQGTTIKHEGYGGYSWAAFAFGGPFYKAGAINVPAYFADNSIDTPDYVHFRLGVNDCFSHANGDFTDAELNAILGYSKLLIDAFLAFDANLKIVIGLPTSCENTGAGWEHDYAVEYPTYSQDKYIEYIHKFQKGFVDYYDNGNYNSRVLVSYETIFLDRNDGYPKTDGIHTNGVHPDISGYEQLGSGIALSINKDLISKLKPTGLTIGWENDYATIDFTDNTSGVAEHEIYESVNGGAYILITTLAAGVTHYHNATYQNASINFRVRAKSGVWLSDFSDVVNYKTPFVLKTNQSTLTNFVITNLTVAAGKTVNIDWGDATNANYTGSNANVTKTYTATGNPYYIKISGDTDFITSFIHVNQALTSGLITKWILPSGIITFNIWGLSVTGSVTNWTLPNTLIFFGIFASNLTGDLSNWIIPASVTTFQIYSSSVSGSLPQITTHPTNGLDFQAQTARLSDSNVTVFRKAMTKFLFNTQAVAFSTANIDKFLKAAADWYQNNAPTANCIFKMDGANNGIPTGGASNADKVRLEGYYTAAGFTATVTVRTS